MDMQRAIEKKRDSRDELQITIAKKLLRAIGKTEREQIKELTKLTIDT